MKEIWKDIPGYGGLYKVSNLGNVFSERYGKVLKQGKSVGYNFVILPTGKNIKTHILVMRAFIGHPNGLVVNHINGIRDDNRLENLEYCTQKQNVIHAHKTLKIRPSCLGKKGYLHPTSKVTLQLSLEGGLIKEWGSASDASEQLGLCLSNICKCCRGGRNQCGGFIWRYK